ncbi:Boi1p NDAI_0E04050 [Naumovozyma dairenensis CBS 421]|uniref:Protein BOI2 n=1 Tax=Naumovozyma dairenensis (strain ATCC 10597 / BCRC 20456 / CBS 421 / NBRC 0211 / NRRL Y-12639) TaxID=1071378 RepID=G0WBV2_NAUDC|nr:hypothetical protein NDAI_0E04050 [Naumovozyma dairenensis CBS 421]CCD25222.1 hypothetical protein NDAI_0E04050 [Naumovozyma dairenensis CBS 421]
MSQILLVQNKYLKQMEDELDLKIGDKIKVITDDGKYNDGWYLGENLKTKEKGLFPVQFTKPYIANNQRNVHENANNTIDNTMNDIDKALRELQMDSFLDISNNNDFTTTINTNANTPGLNIIFNNNGRYSMNDAQFSNHSAPSLNENTTLINRSTHNNVDMDLMNVLNWSPHHVMEYFLKLGFDPKLIQNFGKHKISGKILLQLELNHLKELDINSFGSRFEIFKEIQYIKNFYQNTYCKMKITKFTITSTTFDKKPINLSFTIIVIGNKKTTTYKEKISSNDIITTSSSPYSRSPRRLQSDNNNFIKGIDRKKSGILDTYSYDSLPMISKNFVAEGAFESPGKAPKPPSYPSPIQLKQSPKNNNSNKFRHSSIDLYSSSLPLANNNTDFIFPQSIELNDNNNMISNKNLCTNSTLSSSNTVDMTATSILTEITPISDSAVINSKGTIPNSNTNTNTSTNKHHRKTSSTVTSSSLKRNSVVYTGHKKNQSGGSFIELFNRISTLSPGPMNIKTTTTFENNEIELPQRPASTIYTSSPIHYSHQPYYLRQSSSSNTRTRHHHSHHSRSTSTAAATNSYSFPKSPYSNVTNLQYTNNNNSSSNDNRRPHHTRSISNLEVSYSRNISSSSTTPKDRNNNERRQQPQHKRNSSLLSFFTSFDHDKTVNVDERKTSSSTTVTSARQNSNNLNSLRTPTPLHQRNSSLITSPTKQRQQPSNKNVRSLSSNNILPSPSKDSSTTLTSPNHLRSTSDATNRINKSNHNNSKLKGKQQTSAFQEGRRTIKVEDSIITSNCSGWMYKKSSNKLAIWKKRFFTLHGTRLSYFYDYNDTMERGLIDITSHQVIPLNNESISLLKPSGKYCFKLIPPQPGSKKGLTFTQPRIHYFAVNSKDDMRSWLAALIKATIDIDTDVPVITSVSIPTVSLNEAKRMLKEAREITLECERNRELNEEDEDNMSWDSPPTPKELIATEQSRII